MSPQVFRFLSHFLFAAAALLWLAAPVHAKGYSPVANKTSTGYDVRQAPSPTGGSSLSPVAGGVGVTGSVALPLTLVKVAEAAATGAIGGAAAGGGWGAAAGALGGIAIAAIPAIVDMMQRAKARVKPDGTFEMQDPTVCTVSPCYTYGYNDGQVGVSGYSTASAAAQAWCVAAQAFYNESVTYVGMTGALTFQWLNKNGSTITRGVSATSVAPSPVTYAAASVGDVQNAISANAPTVAEVQALIDLNFPPEVTPVSITGPAEVPLGNTVQLGIDGTKTTVGQTAELHYFPGKVDISTRTTQTVETPSRTETGTTTNPDGSTSTTVTVVPAKTTTSTTTDDTKPDTLPVDTALADIPVLYTAKYPTGLVGVWATQKAALLATPLASLTTSLMPSVAAGGTCPTMLINFTLASWANFGIHDVAPPCYVWDWARVIILVSALLLARALVFGG